MANVVPGVVWQPVDVGSRAARRKGRGLVGHVAVSTSKNLVPGPLSTRNADWHFYLPKTGAAIQYIDLNLQCWATGAGNATMVAFESEGGMGTEAQVNAEPWTENQMNWAARILRHLHDTEGVPLQVMEDSRPTSRGFGTHRLGINPWRVGDGELWSSANAKTCPGSAKHAQRSEIVRRAFALGSDPGGFLMALTDQQQWQVYTALMEGGGSTGRNNFSWLNDQLRTQVAGLSAAIAKLAEAVAVGRDDLTAAELKQAVAEALQENIVSVSVDVAPGARTS